jgi:hypothetical protein
MYAADQPTIEEILEAYDIQDYLPGSQYVSLLAELQNRDNVMRTDAAKIEARKLLTKGLDTIINQR